MEYGVFYCSKTGNTKEIAEIIYNTLPEGKKKIGTALSFEEIEDTEVLFAGFWTDKGRCPQDFARFLQQLHNKKIVLFGTAGFGRKQEYFNQILQKTAEYIDDTCDILDGFMCQGKMPDSVKERYLQLLNKNPDDKKMEAMLNNFEQALLHPNHDDKIAAELFVKKILMNVKKKK